MFYKQVTYLGIFASALIGGCWNKPEPGPTPPIPEPQRKCYFEETMTVITPDGDKQVGELQVGDEVLTTEGFRKIKSIEVEDVMSFDSLIWKRRIFDRNHLYYRGDVKLIYVIPKTIMSDGFMLIGTAIADDVSAPFNIGLETKVIRNISIGNRILIYSEKNKDKREKLNPSVDLPKYCTIGVVIGKEEKVKNGTGIWFELENANDVFVGNVLIKLN